MSHFTIEQKVNVVAWAIAYKNCEKSVRLFAETYHVDPPSVRTIRYWRDKLLETGSLVQDRERTGRPKSATAEERKENVLTAVNKDPSSSTRKIAEECGNLSHMSVQRILKEEYYHPFKPIYCQKLQEDDLDRRLEFCEVMTAKLAEDPAFIRKLKFSDECVFGLESRINQHNIHHYAVENPKVRLCHSGKTVTLTVWACIGHSGVVSYDISRDTMNSMRYCQVLQEKVIPSFSRNRQWWFQHDGAPCHFASDARAILDNSLRDRWIGRRGPTEWPPRSPDLTAADYWFWSYLRSQVYNPPGYKFPDLTTLRIKIEQEMSRIPLDMFRRSMTDFSKRVNLCLQANGDLFED